MPIMLPLLTGISLLVPVEGSPLDPVSDSA
jgi:hypothetical protein